MNAPKPCTPLRLIHAADLHLSAREADYCLSVWEEIISLTRRLRPAYLILAGDIFDSFDDVEALRSEFRARWKPIADSCRVLFVPGNHEELNRGRRDLRHVDLGPIVLMDQRPFTFLADDSLELLAIPHQASYGDYRTWPVPPKRAKTRVAIAHGTVLGSPHAFANEETGGAALDPELFTHFEVDYAALGHIHRASSEGMGNTRVVYPGSSRVWRKGETGPRGVRLVTVGSSVREQFIPLESAGTFRPYYLALSLEGELDDLESEARQWGPADWVFLQITGVVENENIAAALEKKLAAGYGGTVRRLDIDRDGVTGLAGIASQPLARRFLEIWREKEPAVDEPDRRRAWRRSREMALGAIKSILEARP